jgi:catechol 2,3-dioxygenase-like lactoylglutathione lyase family enzyme
MSGILYHIGLTVTDMERARRFYEGAFGFTYDRELRRDAPQLQPLMQLDPPSSIHAVYLTLGDFTLELMAWQPAARTGAEKRVFLETGLTHVSLVVDDVPRAIETVTALGGTALSSVGRAAMVRDPDGQLIELVARDIHEETRRDRAARAAAARA